MKKDNIVELKETVERFLIDTLPYIRGNYEVPQFNMVFPKEVFSLFEDITKSSSEQKTTWKPYLYQESINQLKQMSQFNNELPTIIVHNSSLFFKYLTDITNSLVALYQKYHIDSSTRELHIQVLRRIWLRMGPDDFNQVEIFLERQLTFLQNNILDNYQKETTIGNYCGYDVKAAVRLNETYDESTRCMQLKVYDKENNYHSLANIYYDISNDGTQNICYIYAIQNDRKRNKIPKVERCLYKINKGVLDEETKEYLDYKNQLNPYYPENISDVQPNQIVSLIYFLKILNQNNISKIKVPILQVLSYDYHIILSNQMKIDFPKTWTPEAIEDLKTATGDRKQWLEETYLYDKEWYEHIVDKEDLISKNKSETLIRIIRRASFHNPGIEICNEPFLQGDYLDIKLNKKKLKKK